MAFGFGSAAGNFSSGTSVAVTGVTAASGTFLVITVIGVRTGDNSVTITGASDNAAGSTNVYTRVTDVESGAFDSTTNQFSAQSVIWCPVTTALSSNTVTVTFSASTVAAIAEVAVFTGPPAGTGELAFGLTAAILASKTSQALPSVSAPSGALVVGIVNLNGAISSMSASFTVLNPEKISGYLITSGSGTVSTTATYAGASETWAAATVVFGPPTAISLAESGSAADALAVTAAVPPAETGSAAEALAVTGAVPLAEAGAGAETVAVAASAALAEAGSASDALAVAGAVPLAESGSAADALAAAAAVPLADSGSGADGAAVSAAVPLAESASGTDSISVNAGGTPALAEAGAGAESITIAAAVPLADAGASAEALTAAVAAAFAESGGGSDALAAGPLLVSAPGILTATTAPGSTLTASDSVSAVLTAATQSAGGPS